MRILVVTFIWLLIVSCKQSNHPESSEELTITAQNIIDRSIEASGGAAFGNSSLAFRFRDIMYTARRQNGDFSLSRIQTKDGDSIIDILSNEGFARFINNEFQTLADSTGEKFSASVNSVHYFSILPYGLNDRAVKKRLLGKESIKGKTYYKLEITFDAKGGGEDYEDIFIYWIDKESFKPDYLAYSYEEEDGIGLRFREAYNERYKNGLRFVDYKNYKPLELNTSLTELAQQFEQKQLELVSTIELRELQVHLLDMK